MKYELFYLISASKETEFDKIKADIMKMIADKGGVFEEKETIEKRKLSYEIAHETHGVYLAQRFEMDPENLANISNKINLYPDVLRFIISRADELPELKSKEERINEAQKRSSREEVRAEAKPEVKKPEQKKEEAAKELEKKEEKPAEDIDKKLEEILNI